MPGSITKGTKLSYKTTESGTTYTALEGLQEFPDLGGDKESVEVTTMDDAAHVYRGGLLDYGDSLDFTFLHNATQLATLKAFTGIIYWKLELPDGADDAIDSTFTFTGECSVKVNGAGIGDPITDTLSIKPNSELALS